MDNTTTPTCSEEQNSTEQWGNLCSCPSEPAQGFLHIPALGQSGLQMQEMMVTHTHFCHLALGL